jgi:hypothetical protein
MSQVVVIAAADTTFTANCDLCESTFAGRLDEDLENGVFLCRAGHAITIVRAEPPPAPAAVTSAA